MSVDLPTEVDLQQTRFGVIVPNGVSIAWFDERAHAERHAIQNARLHSHCAVVEVVAIASNAPVILKVVKRRRVKK